MKIPLCALLITLPSTTVPLPTVLSVMPSLRTWMQSEIDNAPQLPSLMVLPITLPTAPMATKMPN